MTWIDPLIALSSVDIIARNLTGEQPGEEEAVG
jgi:hypothetical protein